MKQFGNIDICFLCSGTYDPKKEQEINIEQNKFVMNVNYFGTLNCVKSVEEYFKKAQKAGELNKKTPISFFIYMLKDIQEKLQDEKLKRLYSNEKDLMKDLTNYYFFGIAPKNKEM